MHACNLCCRNSSNNVSKLSRRSKSTALSSKSIRERFIDFFRSKNHSFIRSSSVKPYNDPSLEFVNAGMNQFKNVFLGFVPPPTYSRATNSQKCIRIGGKHNDLNIVGHDSYHHTFFEMLGNWSFGDYFKEEACEMAFELVTSPPYSLNPDRLYATYFNGDKSLNLKADIETKTIWERIGVHPKRIIPFGIKDNFWEMGSTGPCGPCTELHYDHVGTADRPELVNKDRPDLTELWNIVFIQFKRLEDNSVKLLEQNFVDTGMGLERLTALLQNKTSNYDTDLFTPLFDVISEVSGARAYRGNFGSADRDGIDTCYRILADHARMICVALSDNILPEHSHGLRRVIRKALMVSEKLMAKNSVELLIEVIKQVAISLESAYPETSRNTKQIEMVLKFENELWTGIRENVKTEWRKLLTFDPVFGALSDSQSPGLIRACKDLHSYGLSCGDPVSLKLALTFYDRHGLNTELIEELCHLKGLKIDMKKLNEGIDNLKETNKAALLALVSKTTAQRHLVSALKGHKRTDDSKKFRCTKKESGEYEVEKVTGKALIVLVKGEIMEVGSRIPWNASVGLVFDRSNFWTSTKGDGDEGSIVLRDENGTRGKLVVSKALNYSGYIIHLGVITPIGDNCPNLKVGDLSGEMLVNLDARLSLMKNTTASHILTHVLSSKIVCSVQSFLNTHDGFEIKYSIYGQDLSLEDVLDVEKEVKSVIADGISVEISATTIEEHSSSGVCVPPYINLNYGQTQLLNFSYKGKDITEVTLGPNVFNSKDIEDFRIVGCDISSKNRDCTLKAVCGNQVAVAENNASRIKSLMDSLSNSEGFDVEHEVSKISEMLTSEIIPLRHKIQLEKKLEEVSSNIKEKLRVKQEELMRKFLEEARESGRKHVVCHVGENVKLEKLTRLCPDLPVLITACNRGLITARCVVPKDWDFTAESWVKEVSKIVGGSVQNLTGHDSKRVCTLKLQKTPRKELEPTVNKFIEVANSVYNSLSSVRTE